MERKRSGSSAGTAGNDRKGGGLFSSLLFSSLLFSSLLFSSLIIFSLGLAGCTGTGGSANSMGAVYNPDGSAAGSSGGSSGNGGSVSGSSSGSSSTTGSSDSAPAAISADDLHRLANGGLADSITAYFPAGEDETSKTFYLNLSAEDFGVPEDGYMVLAIDSDGFANGGTHWDDTQYISDVDGCAHFMNIPMMKVGSNVTVAVLCYAASGTLISSGYCSGTADDGGIPLEISIIGSPAITVEGGTANGNTAVQSGAQYEVFEYTGTGMSMTAVNGNAGSAMVVKVNGTTVGTTTASSMSAPLSDGFNEIIATVSKGDNEPVEMKRNVYVVKALSEDDIEITFPNGTDMHKDGYAFGADADGNTKYKYSYRTDDNIKMSVTNNTSDNPATGNSTMAVTVTGATSVSHASGNVSNQSLNDGVQTITVTLTKPYCTPVEVEKKIAVSMKQIHLWQTAVAIWFHQGGDDQEVNGMLGLGKNTDKNGGVTWFRFLNDAPFDAGKEDYLSSFDTVNLYFEQKTDWLFYWGNGMYAGGSGDTPVRDVIKRVDLPDLKAIMNATTNPGKLWVDGTNDSDPDAHASWTGSHIICFAWEDTE